MCPEEPKLECHPNPAAEIEALHEFHIVEKAYPFD